MPELSIKYKLIFILSVDLNNSSLELYLRDTSKEGLSVLFATASNIKTKILLKFIKIDDSSVYNYSSKFK